MFSTKCRTCALAHNCHFWFRDRKESEECRYYVFKQDSCPFSRDVDGEVFCVAKEDIDSVDSHCTELVFQNCNMLENNIITRKLQQHIKDLKVDNIISVGKNHHQILIYFTNGLVLRIIGDPSYDDMSEIGSLSTILYYEDNEIDIMEEVYDETRRLLKND